MVQLLVRLMRCIGLLLGVLQLGTKACTARLQACSVKVLLLLCGLRCSPQMRQLHLKGRNLGFKISALEVELAHFQMLL
jgi:hypothetical protein